MNNTFLSKLAIGALVVSASACASTPTSGEMVAAAETAQPAKGQCHGINACKGQGECGGKDHGCAGYNACKGQGWKSMTEAECTEQGGTFKG